MVRQNCDLKEFRADAHLFFTPVGGRYDARISWYDSERGIPGPVYKQAEKYPLSTDRQSDRNLTVQAGGTQELSPSLSLLVKAKYARDGLLYLDVSEIDPTISARWNYLQQSGYASTALAWQASQRVPPPSLTVPGAPPPPCSTKPRRGPEPIGSSPLPFSWNGSPTHIGSSVRS